MKCFYNTNDKVTFCVDWQIINLQLEWNYLWLKCVFTHLAGSNKLRGVSIGRVLVSNELIIQYVIHIYRWRMFIFFFITHTSETALEWIFSKFKHIYEPISSQQSPSTCLSIWKFLLKFKTPKRFKRLASLEIVHHRNLVHFVFRIIYASTFASGDHWKHYTPLFSDYHI